MTAVVYVDASVLARVYFADEPEHAELGRLVFDPGAAAVTSELSRVELASAIRAAERVGRLRRAAPVLARADEDLATRFVTLSLRPATILPEARRIVLSERVRTLDAIHLATALLEAPRLSLTGEVVLLTRDTGQAAAARSLGLALL